MPMKKNPKEKKSVPASAVSDSERLPIDAFLSKKSAAAAAKCARFLSDSAIESLLNLKHGKLPAAHERALLEESERRYDAAMDGEESVSPETKASASAQLDNPIPAEIPDKKAQESSEKQEKKNAPEPRELPEMAEPPKWESLAGRRVQAVVTQLCPNPQYVIVAVRLKIGGRMATYSGSCSIPHKYRPLFRQFGKVMKVEFLPVKNKFAFIP